MHEFAPSHDPFFGEPDEATRQVLYVEDHPVNVLLMQGLLAQRPAVRLTVADSGAEALRVAMAHPPHLLLIDLHLPDCRGADLLERLRAVPALARVPAVAVTADEDAHLEDTSFLEAWNKPLDLYATLRRLDALLELGTGAERAGRHAAPRSAFRGERVRGLF